MAVTAASHGDTVPGDVSGGHTGPQSSLFLETQALGSLLPLRAPSFQNRFPALPRGWEELSPRAFQ